LETVFTVDRIQSLIRDREFVGQGWHIYLLGTYEERLFGGMRRRKQATDGLLSLSQNRRKMVFLQRD